MTLQASGRISVEDINLELGRNATDRFEINGTDERDLADISLGSVSFSDFYSKSASGPSVNISTSLIAESVSTNTPFVSADIWINTDGTFTGGAGSPRWIDLADVGDLTASSYRVRLDRTTGSSDTTLFLGQWRDVTTDLRFRVVNGVSSTTESFAGILTIEEISNPSNSDTVNISLTAENTSDGAPF